MPRQTTFKEGLASMRASGLFSEEELHLVATGHALDVLKYMMEGPSAETPAPPSSEASPTKRVPLFLQDQTVVEILDSLERKAQAQRALPNHPAALR